MLYVLINCVSRNDSGISSQSSLLISNSFLSFSNTQVLIVDFNPKFPSAFLCQRPIIVFFSVLHLFSFEIWEELLPCAFVCNNKRKWWPMKSYLSFPFSVLAVLGLVKLARVMCSPSCTQVRMTLLVVYINIY